MDTQEVSSSLISGKLEPTDHLRQDDLPGWQAAGSVKGVMTPAREERAAIAPLVPSDDPSESFGEPTTTSPTKGGRRKADSDAVALPAHSGGRAPQKVARRTRKRRRNPTGKVMIAIVAIGAILYFVVGFVLALVVVKH